MVAFLIVQISLLIAYRGGAPSAGWFLVAYGVPLVVGYICFARAGINILGYSPGVWSRRRTVYRDVLGIGRS
jgi:hypothetical protein